MTFFVFLFVCIFNFLSAFGVSEVCMRPLQASSWYNILIWEILLGHNLIHTSLALTHGHMLLGFSHPANSCMKHMQDSSSTATFPGAHFNHGKPIHIFILFLKRPSLFALIMKKGQFSKCTIYVEVKERREWCARFLFFLQCPCLFLPFTTSPHKHFSKGQVRRPIPFLGLLESGSRLMAAGPFWHPLSFSKDG